MNIAFINPPFLQFYSRNQRSPAVTKGGTLYYPYWLAYACGWANIHNHKGILFDFVADNTPEAKSISRVKKEKPGLIVIDSATPSIVNDLNFAKKLHAALPKIPIVFVGTHPSALPEEILRSSPWVTAIGISEYDHTIVDIANAIQKKKPLSSVNGCAIRKGKTIIRTKPHQPLTPEDLNSMPFVTSIYKKHLSIKNYYFAAARYPEVMIVTGRGCPFGCNFCIFWQTLHGKSFRARSAQNVADEFAYITRELPSVKEVIIEDDTFTSNIPRVREICRLLIVQNNSLAWSANVRVGVDLETLRLMKQAGCRLIITGFESGDQKLLDAMGKHATVAMAEELMKNTKKAGLLVHGCFMVGNPGETKETMEKTLQHAIRLNPDSAQFYPLFVYPGTVSWRQYIDNKWISTTDFSQWLKSDGEHNTMINLPGLSSEEMVTFCEAAYPKYYIRPKYLGMKIVQLFTNPKEGVRSLLSASKYVYTKLRS